MASSVRRIDMCNGPILPNIIRYALPIMCTSVLQLLFTTADLVVVGRYCGSNSFAAVGATNSLVSLFVNLFIGMSAGVSVAVANAVGEKNDGKISRVIHTAIPLAAILGGIISFLGLFVSRPMLRLIGTPNEILSLSSLYLKIYFCGMIPNFIFEFSSAICRASGDTKTPLKFLSFSGIINVVLNIVFVTLIDLDVAGVAIATVVSQCISAVLMVRFLSRRDDCFKLRFKGLHIYRNEFFKIFKIGLPTGLQSSIFSASNVIIQSSINSFGAAAVAGNAASCSIEDYIGIGMNAFYVATLNYTGQNFGAKNHKRMLKAFWANLLCVGVISAVLISIVVIFSRDLLSLYISDSPISVDYGLKRMEYVCTFYFLLGIYYVFNGFIRGMGYSIITMLISVFGVCGVRIVWIYTVFKSYGTLDSLYVSYPISWGACIAAQIMVAVLVYKVVKKKFTKSLISKNSGDV